MKFFAYAAAGLPLASAVMIPRELQIDTTPLSCNIDLDLDVNLDQAGNQAVNQVDVLGVLSKLLADGEIDITDVDTRVSKRADVPFLHCGYSRAARCALSSGGALATCVWAAISFGKDIKEDSKCIAAVAAFGANLPQDCRLCLGVN
ncbi:hypothetical protein CKM354_000900000 [Cercospora kikuchii]|uniref:Uncharacterized protein n=1 Tax=Cercospora kikuchii TaxID=84275 RepID=A0A9P3CU99_9PEZI|nr:uncharacterized protein CKM354_000900000 [Cercospora kikuchii]GIZ45850.1 hypothetical protein CKM354_000900000 [Cercospora kikuchii]